MNDIIKEYSKIIGYIKLITNNPSDGLMKLVRNDAILISGSLSSSITNASKNDKVLMHLSELVIKELTEANLSELSVKILKEVSKLESIGIKLNMSIDTYSYKTKNFSNVSIDRFKVINLSNDVLIHHIGQLIQNSFILDKIKQTRGKLTIKNTLSEILFNVNQKKKIGHKIRMLNSIGAVLSNVNVINDSEIIDIVGELDNRYPMNADVIYQNTSDSIITRSEVSNLLTSVIDIKSELYDKVVIVPLGIFNIDVTDIDSVDKNISKLSQMEWLMTRYSDVNDFIDNITNDVIVLANITRRITDRLE